MRLMLSIVTAATGLLAGCSNPGPLRAGDAKAGCATLAAAIDATRIGLPNGGATVDSATLVAPSALAVAERGPTPAATITPAAPEYCKVLGRIAPVDPKAPPILFQVNLPTSWNGRSVQYGGGGFNGVLITGLGLVPAAPYRQAVAAGAGLRHRRHRFGPPESTEPAAADVRAQRRGTAQLRACVVQEGARRLGRLDERAYGRGPEKLYFVGSSEGGREGLTMAQRYPDAFDGIFSRVPVIHWTGLQHAGLRDGFATMGDGWIRPPQVKLVHDAVLVACDAADGLADGIVSDPVGCRQRFDVTRLQCSGAASDACLSEPQVRAVQALHSPFRFDFDLANGLREYPGRGPSGENLPSFGPTGGWTAWWLGAAPPAIPPQPNNSIAWFYGAGAIQYFYARNPTADLRSYKPADHAARIREVSALMDSTNPDLVGLPGTRRQAADARELGRLCAEPVCRHRLLRVGGAAPGPGQRRPLPPSVHRARRRPCRHRRAGQRRHAGRAGRLGRARPGAAGAHAGGAGAPSRRSRPRARGRCAAGRPCRATRAAMRPARASFACER